MNSTTQDPPASGERPGVGELLHRITDDVKTLASDEVELARVELSTNMRNALIESGVIVLGAVVALIGLGLLCVAAVVALAPVIASLSLRLVLMAIVYVAVGSITVAMFAKLLRRGASRALVVPMEEARRTIGDVKHAISSP